MKNKKRYLLCSFIIIAMITCISVGVSYNNVEKQEIYISGIMPIKTETEMYLDSDVIVKGTIKEILDSKWSNSNFERGEHISNVLQTDVVVNVDEVYEGEVSGESVVVRIDKGEDENTIVHSEGYPDFKIGERVVLFLSRDDSDVATDEDYYVLTGMKQGKYTLKENDSKNRLNENNVYANEGGELDPQIIKDKVKELKDKNPNYKDIKKKQMAETIKKNKDLFGE